MIAKFRVFYCLSWGILFLVVATNDLKADELRLIFHEGIEYVSDHSISKSELERYSQNLRDVSQKLNSLLGIQEAYSDPRIYVFADREQMAQYVTEQIPHLGHFDVSSRNGLFLLRRGNAYLFVYAGPKCVESIRHEAVHAILNQHAPGLPLWLDEGLAQCFEQENGSYENVNAIKELNAKPWWRPIPSMHQLSKKSRLQDFTALDYAASWKQTSKILNESNNSEIIQQSLDNQ